MGFLQRANENRISADPYTFPGWHSIALPITHSAALTSPGILFGQWATFLKRFRCQWGLENYTFLTFKIEIWKVKVCPSPKRPFLGVQVHALRQPLNSTELS
jgi:hypothetical protein